jgi:regulator of protease activity HflC (stomatin/prohibitin superfamily)
MRPTNRIFLAAAAGCLIGACASEDPIAEAERQFEFVQKNKGDNFEVCDAARKVQQAAREAQNAEQYETWSLYANVYCRHAELFGPYD